MINRLRIVLERYGFYVSSRIADKLGIRPKNVRIFFIYTTFATLGFGFILYLNLAFWLKLKDMIYQKRSSVFDL
ncbi:MAG: PspC domain-containing protein [Flavobacteriaceae bacterium]|nr:PspC domain-containing protein [Flavobacteriaceae bacterium]